jgi:hypothetical protein
MVLSYPVLRHYNISHKDSFDKKSVTGAERFFYDTALCRRITEPRSYSDTDR